MKKLTLIRAGGSVFLILLFIFQASISMALNNPGTGQVTVTSGGDCLLGTPPQASGPFNWEVVEGGSYTMTITGITECTGDAITVWIQNSNTGNWSFNAYGGEGTYTGDFTMPSPACYTSPIHYACSADQPFDNASAYEAIGPNGEESVHLRASTFDSDCNWIGEDQNCQTNECPPNSVSITPSGATTFCEEDSVELCASGATTYLWSTGATSPCIMVKTAGNYTVTGYGPEGCPGTSEASIEVVVNPPPVVTVSADGPTEFCEGDSVILCAEGADTYLWNTGENSECITVKTTGEYFVVGTDVNGCTNASDPVSVTVNPLPTCILTVPDLLPVCGLGGYQLCVTTDIGDQFEWMVSSSDGSWMITSETNVACITYSAGNSGVEGTFTVIVTNSLTGCSSTCTVTFGSRCEEHCTLTQGAYGNCGGSYCGLGTLDLLRSLLSTNLTIGCTGTGKGSITLSSVDVGTTCASPGCLISKLPANGTPAKLPAYAKTCATATGSSYLKNGKLTSVIWGQTLTLGLNLRKDPTLGTTVIGGTRLVTYASTSCVNGVAYGSPSTFNIPSSVLGMTVAQLYAAANNVIGGCATTPSLTDLNNALDAINRGFDQCRILASWDGTVRLTEETTLPSSRGHLTIYPNPTDGQFVIKLQLNEPVDAYAKVYVTNMMGQTVLVENMEVANGQVNYHLALGKDVAAGIYYVRVQVNDEWYTNQMVYQK